MSTRHQWTADELAYLRAHYLTTRTADLVQALGIDARKIYSKAVELGVRKTTETIARMARERSSAPGHGGQRTQFRPGQRPWNKGTHFAPPGSRATQFKPGQVNGRAAKLVQPIGTLRINRSLQVVFASLTILFVLLAVGDWTGSETIGRIAGWEGIFVGLSAVYGSIAQVWNELYGKVVLPLGPAQ